MSSQIDSENLLRSLTNIDRKFFKQEILFPMLIERVAGSQGSRHVIQVRCHNIFTSSFQMIVYVGLARMVADHKYITVYTG